MRVLFCVLLLTSSGFAADTPRPIVHVRNFGIVNEHLLRGGEPTPDGLAELQSAGVKFVLDLRETGSATELEKQRAEKLGMQYTNVPFSPLSAPFPDQMRTVLNMLAQHDAQTVFLHCHRGKDRTGMVVACYRVQHDGWNNERALQEAKRFGMSSIERSMHSFVLHFTPASNAADPILLTH